MKIEVQSIKYGGCRGGCGVGGGGGGGGCGVCVCVWGGGGGDVDTKMFLLNMCNLLIYIND